MVFIGVISYDIDSMLKKYIQKKLESYVKKYFKSHPEVKLVVVAGSVGKTSTKIATATILSTKFRVRLHEGNHNTHLSAPVAILGIDYPENVKSILAWWGVFRAARHRIKQPTDVDVIIQELGIDHPGDMKKFSRYLRPDIAVVTAVTAEHMEYMKDIDSVASEELQIANFSKMAIINRDDIDGAHAKYLTNDNIVTYGTSGAAEYRFEGDDFSLEKGHSGRFIAPEFFDESVSVTLNVLGEHNVRPVVGAVTVAVKLGVTPAEIFNGVAKIRPVSGRMNLLEGINNSMIIDDTYNSSPLAAESALTTLYSLQSPQRIAVLGSMNELGDSSQVEHEALGRFCDPSLLAWVVTVGDDAEKFLAPVAKAKGCQVKSFKSSIDAGRFVAGVAEPGSIILAKGSEGGVYLEETVKILLRSQEDEDHLVRQSSEWQSTKDAFFSRF